MFEDMENFSKGKTAFELKDDLVGGLNDSVNNSMQLMAIAYTRELFSNILIRLDQLDERLELLEKSKKTTSRSTTAKKTESASSGS